MQSAEVRCFTVAHNGIARILTSKVRIQQAFDPKVPPPAVPTTEYNAIWDTGATNTAITNRVATECGLRPTWDVQNKDSEWRGRYLYVFCQFVST